MVSVYLDLKPLAYGGSQRPLCVSPQINSPFTSMITLTSPFFSLALTLISSSLSLTPILAHVYTYTRLPLLLLSHPRLKFVILSTHPCHFSTSLTSHFAPETHLQSITLHLPSPVHFWPLLQPHFILQLFTINSHLPTPSFTIISTLPFPNLSLPCFPLRLL